jgi:hypothetical protein
VPVVQCVRNPQRPALAVSWPVQLPQQHRPPFRQLSPHMKSSSGTGKFLHCWHAVSCGNVKGLRDLELIKEKHMTKRGSDT